MTQRLLLIEANDNTRWVGARVGPKVHVLPIALMGLAAHAKTARTDLEVRIVETSLQASSDEALRGIIEEFRPTWIGVRSISLFIDEVRRVVAVARGCTDAPLLLGGPIATALGRALFEDVAGLDYIAVGEGEPVLAALVAGIPLASSRSVQRIWRWEASIRFASALNHRRRRWPTGSDPSLSSMTSKVLKPA